MNKVFSHLFIFFIIFMCSISKAFSSDYFYENEPSISTVHQWAIHYAEVNKEKIIRWRKLAQKKAWFPKISLGIDSDKNRTTSNSIWGTSSSGGTHYLGPDDKSFDSNFSWDASVTWDLSDLVWNSDQTSIDSRSRSMVKLREDLLNRVTELYFERRCIQMEAHEGMPMTIEKKIRFDELTALIDTLTEGKFSQKMINTLKNHKEKTK